MQIKTPVKLVTRAKFNPNLDSAWLMGVNEIINNITLLAMFLAGAALIRERKHGTIEHLLVMPLRPFEIMLAKVWANGLVIVITAVLSLQFVAKGWLNLTVTGSTSLFVTGIVVGGLNSRGLGDWVAIEWPLRDSRTPFDRLRPVFFRRVRGAVPARTFQLR